MTTVTIGQNSTDTYSGVEDSQNTQGSPTTNHSTSATMESTHYATNDYTDTVIRFTGLSNIPSSATVSSATLYLHLNTATTGGALDHIGLWRVLRNWVNAQVTWNEWSSGNSWTTGGGRSQGNDISATITIDNMVSDGSIGSYVAFTSAQLITDVQNWINGTNANYGWLVDRNETGEDGHYHVWDSSDATDGVRPYLQVIYTDTGGGSGIDPQLKSMRALAAIGRAANF